METLAALVRMLHLQDVLPAELRSRLHSLPQFLIVGAQKGGTTSLYHYLTLHPRILSATVKAVHYFDIHYQKGMGWYRRRFPPFFKLRSPKRITGEASPYYLYHPLAAARIREVIPQVRIIMCLRNPVDRAISHYWDNVRREKENLSMRDAFAAEPSRLGLEETKLRNDPSYRSWPHSRYSYLSRGNYADQVQRYLDHFDRGQILVLRSEDMFDDPQSTYDEVCGFIGLPAVELPDASPQNAGAYSRQMEQDLRHELHRHFKPHNERLFRMLGVDAAWW